MTIPDPAAYESLERRLNTVLGSDDAATLTSVLASLATKDDLDREIAALRADLGLVQLDLRDFKKDVSHEFELAHRELQAVPGQFHRETTRLIKWMVPTIFGGMTAFGGAVGAVVAVASWLG